MNERLVAILVVCVLVGCGDDDGERACVPRAVQACACPSGGAGIQECRSDGAGYEACDCGAVVADSGPRPGDSGTNPLGCSAQIDETAGVFIDTCTGDQICGCFGSDDIQCSGTGTCVDANSLNYVFALVNVGVATTKADGTAWDVIGGAAPELDVEVFANSVSLGRTGEQPEAFAISWDPPATFGPILMSLGTTSIDVQVVDVDAAVDDPAFDLTVTPDAAFLRARVAVYDDGAGTFLTAVVVPIAE